MIRSLGGGPGMCSLSERSNSEGQFNQSTRKFEAACGCLVVNL